MFRRLLVLILPMGVALAQSDTLPEVIEMQRPGFTPEGVEWDAERERFLVGSLIEGTIFAVDDDGTLTPWIEDDELLSSVGIEVDAERDRLLVANSEVAIFSDETIQGNISLGIYDLETGERLHLVPLSDLYPDGRHFANDVAVDADGSAYVTDSFSPVIYKVEVDGSASIFVEDERLGNPFFGLNGIAYHPDGYLITNVAGAGELYKIPVDDPAGMTLVEMDAGVIGDGMIFHPDGSLIVVSGSINGVYRIISEDDWATASLDQTAHLSDAATTAAVREETVYALYAHLDRMGGSQEVYEIVRVNFEE